MLIGIDGNEANEVRSDIGERVGVNQYAFEILWGVYRLNNKRNSKHNFVIYLKNPPKDDLPKENSFWKYQIIPGGGLWVLKKLMPKLLLRQRPDVLFTPSHYLPPLTAVPSVCTIHDLGYLKFSAQFKKYDYWQLKYWTAISVTVSKHIIAVSESTRRDIVRHYPSAAKKIRVIYHGYDKNRFNERISTNLVRLVKKKYSISNDYLLYLSTLKPNKNIGGLLEAFKILTTDKKLGKIISPKSLVIAGKKGWLYQTIFQKVKDLKLGEYVVFTDFVDEKDKPALMAGAKVFVLPSFWEGFGLDILHAMAVGTPVVVSNTASLPEVAGEAGVYVDPYKPDDIADGLRKVLRMSFREYNMLVKAGFKQASKFSWQKTAKETVRVLEGAI